MTDTKKRRIPKPSEGPILPPFIGRPAVQAARYFFGLFGFQLVDGRPDNRSIRDSSRKSQIAICFVLYGAALIFAQTSRSESIITAFHFGDSITYGGGSSNPPLTGWVPDLAATRNWAYVNHGQGGDMAADQSTYVMGHTVATGTISFFALGRNDGAIYGIDPSKMADFSTIALANLAWLAIPDGAKATGKNGGIAYAGSSWQPSPAWATDEYGAPQVLGDMSCTAGDTATAIVANSTVIYAEVSMFQAGEGIATVIVDGVTKGKVNAFPVNPASLTTVNNRSNGVAPQAIRIAGLSDTAHQVQVRVTAGCVATHWIGGNGGPSAPAVAVGIADTGSDNPGATLNAELGEYNPLIEAAANTLAGDGLKVRFIDTWKDLVWPTDFCNPGVCDGTHPNDGGHMKLATGIDEVLFPSRQLPVSHR